MGVAVTFTDDDATVEVEPGGQATCLVRVENTGMVVDSVLLDILGDAAEWATIEPAEVNLLPGASASARISFRPPRAATLAPGEVPFGLRAMSLEDPDGSRIEEGVVQVGEFTDLGLSLVPKSATGRRSARYRLIVENRGNRPESLTVEAADPDVKLAFRSRPTVFSAPAGTATFVRLSAVPRKTFFKGPSQTLPFDVSALPDGGEPVRTQGTMLEKQTLPEWLLPLLGVAVVLAGLILALWLTVLRPIVHSATTAADAANQAAGSAKQAAGSAKSAASAANNANAAASAPPSALNVTLAPSTILARTTELASVTGTFAKGTGALPALVWTSSAPKIAKVSQTGVVTGMSPGSATITATSVTKTGTRGRSGNALTAAKSKIVSGSATVNVVARLRVTSKVLPEAAIGKPYTSSLTASGGTGSFTWALSAGTLPAGLSLTAATGDITGTPTALGKSSLTVHVADAGPPTQFATKVVTIEVVKPLAVDTSSLPGGTVGGSYAGSLAAVGGTPPYTWSIGPGTGNLPSGLTLNPATGAITGVPTSGGTSTFVVQVADAAAPSQSSTESLSITVVSPLSLTTLTLPTAVLNAPYSANLTAFGGSQPFTWSVASGSLPAGLTLSPTSGTISGTPTVTGPSTFTIQVTGAGPPGQAGLSASRTFTLNVVRGFSATTSSLATAKVGQPYTAQLTATGGVTPYVWTLQGTLPPGLTLSPGGTITGTPTATGVFPFTVQAVDSSSPPLSATAGLSIVVVSPLRITTTSLPEAVTGVAYSQTVGVTGGVPPLAWSVTAGQLPDGLRLSPSTGTISGTPVTTGRFTFTVSVQDSDTPTAHSASLSTSISVVEPLNFTEPALPLAAAGESYPAVTPNHVSGGSGAYTWSITSGVLPPGLTLDTRTGTISGTVSGSAQLGDQNFTLTIADAKDPTITSSQQLSITVNPGLQMAPPSLTIVANNAFSQSVAGAVSGGRPPYKFSGFAIDFLTIDASGTISGVPDAPCNGVTLDLASVPATATCGSTTVTSSVTVTDASGSSVNVPVSLTETVAPLDFVLPSGGLPGVSRFSGYDAHVTGNNGALPTGGYGGGAAHISFSTSATPGEVTPNNGGLPCNVLTCSTGSLGINTSTGEITGDVAFAPVVGTTFNFNVTIINTDPLSESQIAATYGLSITDSD